eukprot:CAMPEP_0179407506 /NCGR_PEP_ID=MMETSP0799-20121207/1537_1 /TAXON_ID=46947 /ORGANISM="Geminigera cryophila, Strain CCMP2564" /LENGTH=388 /DNA_ID=CAMNT_0021178787 /DNA_START=44 /DNA_END=1207 /DNA_ORIENTATION=+
MPLLPGETRESDKYVSGLSFIDDIGTSVKRAAERTQARIEQGYNELASSLPGADIAATVARSPMSSLSGGHMVPVATNWDTPGLMPLTIMPAVYNVGIAIREHGDPLIAAPATTLLVACNIFAFSRRVPVRHWSLLPYVILYDGEVYRLLTSAFLHRTAPQLISNMSTLICSGLALERRRGWKFAGEVLAVTITANVLRFASMSLRAMTCGTSLQHMPIAVFGGLGFSASCFALQVMAAHESRTHTRQLELPGQWRQMTCWVMYGMHALMMWHNHSATPLLLQADLEYDLCGIVAGLGFVWGPRLLNSLEETRNLRAWARAMYGNTSRVTSSGGGQRLGGGASPSLTPTQRAAVEAAAARDVRDRERAAAVAAAAATRQSSSSRGSYV